MMTTNNAKSIKHCGLTLIETIIGLGIAVAIIGLVIQTYTVTMRLSKSVIQRVEQLEESQLILEQITRDLHNHPFQSISTVNEISMFELMGQSTTEGIDPYLSFLSIIYDPKEKQISPQKVTYSLKTVNRIIRYYESPNYSKSSTPKQLEKPLGIGLNDTIYHLDIQCWDITTIGNAWKSNWINSAKSPGLIKINLYLENQRDKKNKIQLTRFIKLNAS